MKRLLCGFLCMTALATALPLAACKGEDGSVQTTVHDRREVLCTTANPM